MAGRAMFRMVDLPDEVPGRLFLHRMPGRLEPLQRSIDEIRRRGISQVICLAPLAEVEAKSPEYARLLRNGGTPWRQVMFPIVDFGVPSDRQHFLAFVIQVAQSLRAGDYMLAHCAGGIGRTGLLASAVLVVLGVPVDEALQRAGGAGSHPERPEQVDLVQWVGETVGARMAVIRSN
jgi:protein-tyrosine phosphatase